MNLLGKNISANLLSNVWLAVLSLALTPFYIFYLGVESYGLIGFYLSWVAIVGILDTGISATAIREIAWHAVRPDGNQRILVLLRSLEVVYWGIILILGIGILAGAWFFGAGWFELKELSSEIVRDVLMLMAVSLIVQVPSGLYIGGLMGWQRQVECSGLIVFFATVRGLGSILVLSLISPDIRAFFLWHIVASVLQTGVIRWSLFRKVSQSEYPVRFSINVLRSIKGFAGTMMLITVLGIIMSQMDKMILSRVVSLEAFGFYMLAWTVVSGFSRVATPLIQAFSPKFTELVSVGDDAGLAKQVRFASQLMSTLIIPPAVLIMFLAKPLLFVWLGNQTTSESVAPILVVMVLGTVFTSCSFPALSVLYSRKRLRPVLAVNVICLLILLPLLILAVVYVGVLGAAFIWVIYGLSLYVWYQVYGLQGLPNVGLFSCMWRDFVVPFVISIVIVGIAGFWLSDVSGKITFIFAVVLTLLVSWFIAFLACGDLRKIVIKKWK
jgi:O-antigen/teichoic acid export membrane protein